MLRWSTALVLATALAGCDAKDEPTTCDPFDASAQPIELRMIRGIGRDANGTLYVVDHDDGEASRVFVSANDELARHRIARESGGGLLGTGIWYQYEVETEPLVSLQIFDPADAPMRMGLVRGGAESLFEIGEEGEELEVLDADAIEGMPVRNLPGEVVLEYAARTDDERLLVVTRPSDVESYDEFRLFSGPSEALEERIVHSVVRELDGGTTTIELELDGVAATAYFPADVHDLPWTLTIADATTELTRLDAVPNDVAFRCLAEDTGGPAPR